MYQAIMDACLAFWDVLGEMAPFLLFGFLMAGILSVFVPAELIERHLGGSGFASAAKAAIFGIPLPLCSCGVIPVSASLRRHKAGKGATASFLIATPQTGVDSILVTLSLLGWVFAIFRPIAALVSGVIGGTAVSALSAQHAEEDDGRADQEDHTACCGYQTPSGKIRSVFHYGFVTLARDIGTHLLIGLVIAGVISALVPGDFFAAYLGTGIFAMLVLLAGGIPVYVCATASVPIAAAMIAKGITPGAALVFLMTGPATNAATVAILWRIMGKRATIVYIASVAVTALASGLMLDYIFQISGITPGVGTTWMIPPLIKHLSAITLLGILAYAILTPHRSEEHHEHGEAGGNVRITLPIEGMTCSHCAETVRKVLTETKGVKSVQVDLEGHQAVVSGDDPDLEKLCQAVESVGYDVNKPKAVKESIEEEKR